MWLFGNGVFGNDEVLDDHSIFYFDRESIVSTSTGELIWYHSGFTMRESDMQSESNRPDLPPRCKGFSEQSRLTLQTVNIRPQCLACNPCWRLGL